MSKGKFKGSKPKYTIPDEVDEAPQDVEAYIRYRIQKDMNAEIDRCMDVLLHGSAEEIKALFEEIDWEAPDDGVTTMEEFTEIYRRMKEE